MLVAAVDDEDKPVGIIRRKDVFKQRAGFRVVHVLVFNSDEEILLQRLALTRERHPGFWGSSVAGYLFAPENYIEAASRRLKQELGVEDTPLDYVGKTEMDDDGCTKFIGVFRVNHDGPFSFDRSVIQDVKFESVHVIDRLRSSEAVSFTPTFLHVLRFYRQQRSLGR